MAVLFGWNSCNDKPEPHRVVLLQMAGGEFTTGWWSDMAGAWIGLALNQSPPVYAFAHNSVLRWMEIPDADRLRKLRKGWLEYAEAHYCQTYNNGMALGLRKAAMELGGLIGDDGDKNEL